jgi:hypothetical protein
MADSDRVAGIYSEVKYRFDRKSIQTLRKFKRDLMELKSNLRDVKKLTRGNVKIGFTAKNAKVTQQVAKQSKEVKKDSVDTARVLGKQNKLRENSVKTQARMARQEKQQRKVAENAMRAERDHRDRMARSQARLARIAQGSDGRVTERSLRAAQRAQERYNRKLRDGVITMGHYNRASQQLVESLRAQGRAAQNTSMSFNQMRGAVASATGAYSAYAGAVGLGAVGGQFESARVMLETAVGAEQAGEMMDFLIAQSERLGIGAAESAKGFARFAIAGKEMGFTIADMKEQFAGISEASAVFGLRQDEQLGVIRALEQMMAKGVVMSEELDFRLAA